MKHPIVYIFVLFLTLTSCEDVIDIETKDAPPKLVIEALINWEKGTLGNEQTIRLTQSTSYFEETIVNATGATVTITHENGSRYSFTESTPGVYTTRTFEPELDATYTLEIMYENETYQAVEKMISVPPITSVTQRVEEFGGEEIPVVAFTFDDPPEIENRYLITIFPDFQPKKEIDFFDDEFIDGNEIESVNSSDYVPPENEEADEVREYQTGDLIDIKLFGISERFYNYVAILYTQANADGGPFSIAPAIAKGNGVNTTNPTNFPYGYFRLSEVVTAPYVYE